MAEAVIRKACDRCHAQKLSCKRYNDEPCERCVRLKTECKSSPSLRYKKNQQQLVESQQQLVDNNNSGSSQQQQQLYSAPSGRRSPKRRRTDSQDDPSLVSPDTGTGSGIGTVTGTCPLFSRLLSRPRSRSLVSVLDLNRLRLTAELPSSNSTPYRQPDV